MNEGFEGMVGMGRKAAREHADDRRAVSIIRSMESFRRGADAIPSETIPEDHPWGNASVGPRSIAATTGGAHQLDWTGNR
jgi:hypothetical protein